MSLDGQAGTPAVAVLDSNGRTGLAGTVTWQLIALPAGTAVTSPSTVGVVAESAAPSFYDVTFTRPAPAGEYAIVWNLPGVGQAEESFTTSLEAPATGGLPGGGPGSIAALIQRLTIDGVQLHDQAVGGGAQLLEQPVGLLGAPQIRDATVDRYVDDGVVELDQFYMPRIPTLRGKIDGADWASFLATKRALATAFLRNTDHTLVLTLQSGEMFQCSVRCISDFDPIHPLAGVAYATYQVQLRAADPRLYSTSLVIQSFDAAAPAPGGAPFPWTFPVNFGTGGVPTFQAVNAGNYRSDPVWVFNGPWDGVPSVQNQTRGEALYLTAPLGAADQVVVDTHQKIAWLNGTEARGLIDWNTSEWVYLSPGANQIQPGGGYHAGSPLGLERYDAWIGV